MAVDQARIAEALRAAIGDRPEITHRGDRCRAVLNDTLAQDAADAKREVGLLVAAVEDGVPSALEQATSQEEVDAIVGRFCDDRGFAHASAQWAVDSWVVALQELGRTSAPVSSIPATDDVPSDGVPGDLAGDDRAVRDAGADGATDLVTADDETAPDPVTVPGDLSLAPAPEPVATKKEKKPSSGIPIVRRPVTWVAASVAFVVVAVGAGIDSFQHPFSELSR